MIGILLAICVAFLKSLGELAGKVFTDTKKKDSLDEYSLAWGTRLFSFFLLIPLIAWIGFPRIESSLIFPLFFSSCINAITTVTALKAVKYGDLSVVSPLTTFTIPFLFITSFFITQEIPNSYGFIWVIIIFIGTYFLNIHELRWGFLAPIKAIFDNLWARYMFLTALLWSISAPLDKLWVLQVGAIEWMFLTNALISFLFFFLMLFLKKSLDVRPFFSKKYFKKISAITVLGWLGAFLQMLALKYTLVIYVIALKRASGIFSVFLGWIFFKEKNITQKLIAASIMLIGVMILTLWGNI